MPSLRHFLRMPRRWRDTTFERLLPQPLNRFYPSLDNEWGIGLTWMRLRHARAGMNGVPQDAEIFGRNVIGHGSATAAILCVDPDPQLRKGDLERELSGSLRPPADPAEGAGNKRLRRLPEQAGLSIRTRRSNWSRSISVGSCETRWPRSCVQGRSPCRLCEQGQVPLPGEP